VANATTTTVGLGAGALLALGAVASRGELAFPLIGWTAVVLAIGGAAMQIASRFALPGRLATRRRALRALGGIAAIAGAVIVSRADASLDALPSAPLLVCFLGLPPPVGAAVAAAGVMLLARKGDRAQVRWLLYAGAIGLGAAVVYPLTVGGEPTIPLAARAGTGAATLTLALFALAGAALTLRVATEPPTNPALLPVAAGVLLALYPLWLAGRDELGAAAAALALEFLVGASLLANLEPAKERDDDPLPAAETAIVVVIALVWWLVEIHGFRNAADDQYIYFYAARRWSEGAWPYRDFFFSHPPLHLAVPALLFKLFGFHLALAKLVAPVAVFAAALILWRGARRHFGRRAGLITFGMFLFSVGVLRAGSTFTGVELTTLFLCAGLIAALDRRALAAGIWFGLAASTGVYGLAGFATFVVLAAFAPARESGRIRRDALQMALGFAAAFLAINLLFWAIAGARYLDGVYRYHFLKPGKNAEQLPLSSGPQAIVYNLFVLLGGRDLRGHLALHAAWYVAALAAPVLAIATRKLSWRPRSWWPTKPGEPFAPGAALLLALSLLGLWAELGSFQERYEFYFTLTLPFLALLAGFALDRLLARPVWAAALLALSVPVTGWALRSAFQQEQGGERITYDWRASSLLPSLGEVSHALFWHGERQRGDAGSPVAHYLWSEQRTVETAPEIAEYIAANTTADDTLTGASDLTPLLALLSHRRLAGDQIDTNGKVFATGVVNERDFWERVCKDRIAFVVVGPDSFWSPQTMSQRLAGPSFQEARTFIDNGMKQRRPVTLQLWRRIHEPPAPICDPF
jgi:hypothetical protein